MHNTRAAALWRDWQHTGRSLDATNVPCRGLAEYLFGSLLRQAGGRVRKAEMPQRSTIASWDCGGDGKQT
ncbi:hypothetical protein P8C59_005872 [Phyllachora maydis]|uniref:Uncharacterized protein n=1 Tax=Phyllachora maydis TaxID=1825666 RepID=A0AAD9MEY2_9PEZI|nr:hypothetical protein P8C59_005872 [Phyllachora maydis]